MTLEKIGKVSLKNSGLFVAGIAFTYKDNNGNMKRTPDAGDITLGFTGTADPGKQGVPDDATFSVQVVVRGGSDKDAPQSFIYKKGNRLRLNTSFLGAF